MIRLTSQHLIQFCAPLILMCAGASSTFAQETLPAEAYAKHPRYSDARLSPDGSRVALAIPNDGGDYYSVVSFANPDQRRDYPLPSLIVTSVHWVGQDELLATAYGDFYREGSRDQDYNVVTDVEWYGVGNRLVGHLSYIAHPSRDESPMIVRRVGRSMPPITTHEVIDLMPDDDIHFLIRSRGGILHRVVTSNGDAVRYESHPVACGAHWFTDGHGNVVACIRRYGASWNILVPDGPNYREIASLDDQAWHGRQIVGASRDGDSLVVQARINDRLGLYPFSLADGSLGDPLFFNDESDFSSAVLNDRTFRVEGAVYQQGAIKRTHYFSPEMQSLQQTLEDVFPEHTVEIMSRSTDGKMVLLQISSPTRPPAVGIFDRDAETIDTVSEAYPDLRAGPFGEVQEHSYTTADGTELVGILTLPPDVSHQNLPMVVLGDAPSGPTFDKLAHFLATRGYATFRPGVRKIQHLNDITGSDELADWVQMIQEDYTAGIDDLIENRIVDPARVCIYGRGLDGYTALISAVYSADHYACVISANGVTEIERNFTSRGFSGHSNTRNFLLFDQSFSRNYGAFQRDYLEPFSPVARAGDVGASVLLLGYDRGGHAPWMATSLRQAGKSVEYVKFIDNAIQPADDREQNMLLEYSTIERYLREQIGP